MAFTPKTSEETVRYGFNFGLLLDAGESIATSIWSIQPTSGGTDASAASMLFGTPIYTLSPTVRHLVTAGVAGVEYLIEVEITTDQGQVLQSSQYLGVT